MPITLGSPPHVTVNPPRFAWILRDGRLEIETSAGEVRAIESGAVRFER